MRRPPARVTHRAGEHHVEPVAVATWAELANEAGFTDDDRVLLRWLDAGTWAAFIRDDGALIARGPNDQSRHLDPETWAPHVTRRLPP
ncbi:MAG TPA: hypothetical protein VLA43_16820 [Longimicrobiales bacterium]|nr:hypothetical protein [Longimicrobiales bacterium]